MYCMYILIITCFWNYFVVQDVQLQTCVAFWCFSRDVQNYFNLFPVKLHPMDFIFAVGKQIAIKSKHSILHVRLSLDFPPSLQLCSNLSWVSWLPCRKVIGNPSSIHQNKHFALLALWVANNAREASASCCNFGLSAEGIGFCSMNLQVYLCDVRLLIIAAPPVMAGGLYYWGLTSFQANVKEKLPKLSMISNNDNAKLQYSTRTKYFMVAHRYQYIPFGRSRSQEATVV